jgi:hypothetical protein
LLDDEVRDVPEWRHPRTFNYQEHSFNPLDDLDYWKACTIVDISDAVFTGGDGTLTKDEGLDFISDALERATTFEDLIPRPDWKSSPGHVWAYRRSSPGSPSR